MLRLNLAANAIIAWNTVYMAEALDVLRSDGFAVDDDDLAHVPPTLWSHVNIYGKYEFDVEGGRSSRGPPSTSPTVSCVCVGAWQCQSELRRSGGAKDEGREGGEPVPTMRLVFLYGPPGVGKLTVARELAVLTNFKVFHNHLTISLARSVFPFGSAPYSRLVRGLRREVFAEAAQENVDLIFTFVYAHPEDETLVRELIEPVISRNGAVLFVQLTCDVETLFERVQAESRRAYDKITEAPTLREVLHRYDLFVAIPFGDSLNIDTTDLSAGETAARIAAHFRLPTTLPP